MSSIIIIVGIFALMWLLLLRPQRKKAQAQQDMLRNLAAGDDVVTSSGIYGRINSMDNETVFLEITDDIKIKIAIAAIAQKVSYVDETGTSSNGSAKGLPSAEPETDEDPDPDEE